LGVSAGRVCEKDCAANANIKAVTRTKRD
jgi:hypothetical protein